MSRPTCSQVSGARTSLHAGTNCRALATGIRDADRDGRHHHRNRYDEGDGGDELGERDRTSLPAPLPRNGEADITELGGHGALLVRISFLVGEHWPISGPAFDRIAAAGLKICGKPVTSRQRKVNDCDTGGKFRPARG